MHFPVANIDLNPLVPPLVAFAISLLTSMGGVSGAFLILPFQMSVLGFVSPAVSPTNQLYNIVAIPGGAWRYLREGRMAWPLVGVVILGTLPGTLAGAFIRLKYLPDPARFKLFAALVLLYIGARVLREVLRKKAPDQATAEDRFLELAKCETPAEAAGNAQLMRIRVVEFNARRIAYDFAGSRFRVSSPAILGLSAAVGVVGGIYGIGGGAILAPIYVAFFGLPVYTVAGAALLGTFITSVAGVAFFLALAPAFPQLQVAPDWALGVLFGLGGLAGMYLGARLQKFFPARAIKLILVAAILLLALQYAIDFARASFSVPGF
jgi:uncharacterized protein